MSSDAERQPGDPARWPRRVGGRLALDFVNTAVFSDHDPTVDALRSVAEFRAWSRFVGIDAGPDAEASGRAAAALADAVALRAALRAILDSVVEGRDVGRGPLDVVRSAHAHALRDGGATLVSGRLRWTWAPGARFALAELAADAVELLRGGDLERVKTCPGCGFLFLDSTKNRTRRWCAMEDCGTREKTRRYVARRAAASARDTTPGS